jgi:hypothetical protein
MQWKVRSELVQTKSKRTLPQTGRRTVLAAQWRPLARSDLLTFVVACGRCQRLNKFGRTDSDRNYIHRVGCSGARWKTIGSTLRTEKSSDEPREKARIKEQLGTQLDIHATWSSRCLSGALSKTSPAGHGSNPSEIWVVRRLWPCWLHGALDPQMPLHIYANDSKVKSCRVAV